MDIGFDDLISSISTIVDEQSNEKEKVDVQVDKPSVSMFNIDQFVDFIKQASIEDNRRFFNESKYIIASDITNSCIRQTVFRLLKVPTTIREDVWLPVRFRSYLGKAIHSFIQDHYNFSEIEVSMRVPSINVSLRIDAIINNNVLVEVKSLPFKDYVNIVKSRSPRFGDFKQLTLYKYIIENYLDEIKSVPLDEIRTQPPKLDSYNIDTFQIIYVAHDVISTDFESISDMYKYISWFKKVVNSKDNQFYFICCLDFKLDSIPNLNGLIDEIKEHIKEINYYVNNSTIPPMNHKFVNKKMCYFCQYGQICK